MSTAAAATPRPRPRVGARAWGFVKHHALTVYAFLVVAYLMLPIAVVILFSFNNPAGRFNYVWQSFTFDNWIHWDAVPGLRSAPDSTPCACTRCLRVRCSTPRRSRGSR